MSYRRRRSSTNLSSTVADSAAIANRLSPLGALTFGAAGFTVLYVVVPLVLTLWADGNKAKLVGAFAPMYAKLIDDIFLRRLIYPSELAGIAILLVCTFISIWKLASWQSLSREDERDASWLARLLSRWLD